MNTYLSINVPVDTEAQWYNSLTRELDGVGVRWQNAHYHITLAYLDKTPEGVDFGYVIDQKMFGKAAPRLSFDKLDAFTGGSGKEHIVYLTVSDIPERFSSWVTEIRKDIVSAGGVIKSGFKLHVTLGRVDVDKISLEELQARINKVHIPSFSLRISELEYMVPKVHKLLKGWRL